MDRIHDLYINITAVSPDKKLVGIERNLLEGKRSAFPEIRLEGIPGLQEISGMVVDAEGKPVENAIIGTSGMRCMTDGNGRFSFYQKKDAGIRNIYALKPGVGLDFVDQSIYGYDSHIDYDKIPPYTDGPFHFKLEGGTVKVRVVDEAGRPLKNAVVAPEVIRRGDAPCSHIGFGVYPGGDHVSPPKFLQPWQAKTNAAGIATFDWIPMKDLVGISFISRGGWNEHHPTTENFMAQGTWEKLAKITVNATHHDIPDYNRNAEKSEWEEIDWVKLFREPVEIKVNYMVMSPPVVIVSVKDRDGEPMCGTVIGSGNWGGASTDIDGKLVWYYPRTGQLSLVVNSRFGAAPGVFDIPFRDGMTTNVDITLEKGTRVFGKIPFPEARWGGSVRFDVFELRPDSDEKIRRHASLSRDSNNDYTGTYEMVLPPGRFDIQVRCAYGDGKHRMFKKILVIDGKQEEIELDIQFEIVDDMWQRE